MGENLIRYYREKVDKSWKLAFGSAFVLCLLVHLYKFTNTLLNHDSLYNVYSNQDITGSGRWFLQYACGISSYFDLPWVNGLLCAVYLGLTAAVIVALFRIKNPVVIVLTSAILVSCPATTETLFFGYTADGYMMGLLFCAVAALLSCKATKIWHSIVSGILLCLACGIYQAYISFAIVLCACYLVYELLNDRISVSKAWKWIGRHAVIYGAALASYYIIWKAALHFKHISAVGYQGIDTVGKVGISTILHGFVDSLLNLFHLLIEQNFLKHPISLYAALNLVLLLAFAVILIVALVKSGTGRQLPKLFTILLVLGACIPLISLWEFTSDSVYYRPMMLHSVFVFFIFTLILADQWLNPHISSVIGLLMAIIVFNFSVMANTAYFYMHKSYEKSYCIGVQMMTQIQKISSDQHPANQIAFIGDRTDQTPLFFEFPANRLLVLSRQLEKDLFYDGSHAYLFLNEVCGLEIPEAPEEMLGVLMDKSAVKQMPIWPAEGSVALYGDTIVVKLGE